MLMQYYYKYTALLLLITAVSCLPPSDRDDSEVLARVGNSVLTFNDALSEIPSYVLAEDTAAAILSFQDRWIQSQVAYQEAERLGIGNSAEIRQKLNRLRAQLMQDALKEHVLQEHEDELSVTTAEAQNYYQAHKEQFILEERYVRFRHLTTNTRTAADNAKREIMRGTSWDEVVREYSVKPELQLRESNQYWPISMAVPDIAMLKRFLNVIGITEISPIHYQGGQYHFVQLMEVRPEGDHPDLDWLIPQIKEWLRLEKARRITNGYIRNLYLESEANNEIEKANVTDIETLTEFNTGN